MNNKYIYYPNLDFDLEKIKEIVFRNDRKRYKDLATHQHRIKEEPYLIELQEKYPFLSNIYNIYSTAPGYRTPIHICPNRGCAINIPISYTEDSHTIFYEIKDNAKLMHIKERIYDVIREEDATEVFRYTLDRPTLMNTQLPHGVIGGPLKKRTIMSWSINLDSDYETTRAILMSMSKVSNNL